MTDTSYYLMNNTLEHVYLEDSYVLSIQEENNSITFLLETVLLEEHPLYTEPLVSEAHCYKEGTLSFPNTQSYSLVRSNAEPVKDPDGSVDYGNIDEMYLKDSAYFLSGEWGTLTITSDSPIITLT
jgi:hypothetical protein